MKEVLRCFMYIREKALGENYKEAYKLCRDRNPMTRLNIDAKSIVEREELHLKS